MFVLMGGVSGSEENSSPAYIQVRLTVRFGLMAYQPLCHLISNPVYTYMLNIYDL